VFLLRSHCASWNIIPDDVELDVARFSELGSSARDLHAERRQTNQAAVSLNIRSAQSWILLAARYGDHREGGGEAERVHRDESDFSRGRVISLPSRAIRSAINKHSPAAAFFPRRAASESKRVEWCRVESFQRVSPIGARKIYIAAIGGHYDANR